MEHLRKLRLLDESGKPLGTRVEGVLERLLPRFQRQFPTFRDEVTLTEVYTYRMARREPSKQ